MVIVVRGWVVDGGVGEWVGGGQRRSRGTSQYSLAQLALALVGGPLIGAVDDRLPRARASSLVNCSVSSVVVFLASCTTPCAFMGSEPTGYVIIGLCFLW